MRLWSLHPSYLDSKGLVACWREALLAKAVLEGRTKGYRSHPQLARFRLAPDPVESIDFYLKQLHTEASRRGYAFDGSKFSSSAAPAPIPVTRGQLAYELEHLRAKLAARDQARLAELAGLTSPRPNPAFAVVEGGREGWEIVRS